MTGAYELRKLAGNAMALARGPVRLAVAIDASLAHIGRMAAGVEAMHKEFLGMREDIRGLSGQIEVLTTEVSTLGPPIEGILGEMPKLNARVEQMDDRLNALSGDLRPIGALAGRFSAGRGRRGTGVAPRLDPSAPSSNDGPRELPR